MKCAKCNGEMEEGIVKGSSGYDAGTKWGKEISWRGKVKDGKAVIVYRCTKCGYLESYAK